MSSHHLARLLINNSEQWGQPRQGLDMKKKKKKIGMGPKAKTDSWLNEINLIKQRLVQELKLI